MKVKLLLLTLLVSVFSWGQTTIFSETLGTVSGTTTIAAHETANGFDNDGYTMTNGAATLPADLRATSPSSGSGSANVFFTTTNNQYGFAIEGIDASTFGSLTLDYLYRKESTTVHATFAVEYWNGTAWVSIANTAANLFNETATAAIGWYSAKQLSLPVGAQISGLKIRFLKSGTASIRIDDIVFKGTAPTGFSVTYNGNVSTGGTVPTDATSYASGATVTVLGNTGTLVKTGYTFAGWNTAANGSGTNYAAADTFSITANTTLYARWTANNNTITFDKNAVDATGTTASQTIATAATASLTANGFSRVGYTFAGWATTAGGAVAYADGASYTMGTANVTLYAVWNSLSPFTTTSGTLSALSTTYGTASSTTTFTVSAGNLTNNLIITAPTGFEVSVTAGSGFATSIDLGTIDRTNTTIYVRLAATTDFGTYSGNVVASSTGVTSVNVATASSNVTKKALTITGLTGVNKVYDGLTTATLSGTAALSGVLFSDDVTLSGTSTSNFADKNVGTGKTITTTGYTFAGTKAANYSVTQPSATANITAKALSISAPTIASKVYNASAVSGVVTVGTLSGFVSPETVTATATGLYADANAAIGKTATITYVLANGTNGGLATNYSLATGTGTGDITKATPVFTTSAIAVNVGGAYTLPGANIATTSDGTLSYSITSGGFATLTGSTINGVSVGSETLTVNQAASTNYFAGSTTVGVNVTTVVYVSGDYRSTSNGNWHSTAASNTASWEAYNGASWVSSTAPPTNAASLGTKTVYIRNDIFLVGTNTAPYVVVDNGGILSTSTVSATFGNLLVKTGGTFNREGNGSGISGILEVEDNATMTFKHTNTSSRSTSIWAGTEKFHANSNFEIVTVDNTAMTVVQATNDVSTYTDPITGTTACFGNVIVNCSAGKMNLVPSGFNLQLTHKDLIFRNNSDTTPLSTGNITTTIGGNLIVENTYGQTINFASTASTINITVKGNFVHNGTLAFRPTSNLGANSTFTIEGNLSLTNGGSFIMNAGSGALTGTSTVNLKGNLEVSSTSIINSTATGIHDFNFTATTGVQTINVANAATASNITFNVNSGSYTKLINQDFALGTNSSFTVKTGGTFDFGFNGSTALNLVRVTSQIAQSFASQTGSILKITSPLGITSGSTPDYTGNVQVGSTGANRNFNVGATYHYIGKANQVSGNGLPLGITGKVIVELDTDALVFNASGNKTIATAGTLDIKKGIVEDTSTNSFGDLASNTGNLTMSGGRYRIFKAGTQPDLSGTYNLTAGVVEFAGPLSKTVRSPKSYQNIEVTGNDVGNSSGNITLNNDGTFTVKSGGIFTINANAITGPTGNQTLTVEGGGLFKTGDAFGFNGGTNTSVKNDIETISLLDDSTVEYSRATGTGDQIITLFSPAYRNLTVSGIGTKTLQSDTATRVEEDLNIVASKLLLEINKVITVKQGVIIAATGAEFEVQNNAQLIQIDETDTNSGTNFKLKRIAFVHSNDYVYWSSPVVDFNVGLIPTQQRYYWDPIFLNSNGSLGNWRSATGVDATMIKGKGYIVNSGNGFPVRPLPAGGLDADFAGRPNNGTLTTSIQRGDDAASIDDNWNLIGNPYPSAIFAEEFLDANTDKINGSVWVWTHGQAPDNAVDPYYYDFQYNYYATDYIKYNKLGATDTTFNGIIASGQGFMVNMKHSATLLGNSVTFTNAMRTDATALPYDNTMFFKSSGATKSVATAEEKHRIWLDIVNTTVGQKDSALLGYSAGSTLDVDHFYDCIFVPKTEVGLYSLIGLGEYVIQGRPLPFVDSDLVPMGIKIVNAGNHTIAIKKIDGLFEGSQAIYLEDKLLNIIHDLKAAPYNFTSEVGVFNDRFVVRYTATALSNDDFNPISSSVIVASQDNQIAVKSAAGLISSVSVYDVLGREIIKKKDINNNEITFTNVSAKNQALIVRITLENGQIVTRKIIL